MQCSQQGRSSHPHLSKHWSMLKPQGDELRLWSRLLTAPKLTLIIKLLEILLLLFLPPPALNKHQVCHSPAAQVPQSTFWDRPLGQPQPTLLDHCCWDRHVCLHFTAVQPPPMDTASIFPTPHLHKQTHAWLAGVQLRASKEQVLPQRLMCPKPPACQAGCCNLSICKAAQKPLCVWTESSHASSEYCVGTASSRGQESENELRNPTEPPSSKWDSACVEGAMHF